MRFEICAGTLRYDIDVIVNHWCIAYINTSGKLFVSRTTSRSTLCRAYVNIHIKSNNIYVYKTDIYSRETALILFTSLMLF